MISLNTALESIPRVSKRILPALKRLGIKTVRDMLFYFPARYEDFSNVKTIRELALNETATIRGKIVRISGRRTSKKRMVIVDAVINDGTGQIKALWFNQPFLLRNLMAGNMVSLSGKVALGPNGIYLQNPAHERIGRSPTSDGKPDFNNALHTGGLVAIYPETRGITSRWLRYLIKMFIELRAGLEDVLADDTRRKYQFPGIRDAVYSIHFPRSGEDAEHAKKRFSFEKLLLIQLRALKNRMNLKKEKSPAVPFNLAVVKEFVRSLPFELTTAQRRTMWEIFQDISKDRPMNRLLEGDVGSGKTVVAASSALLVAKAGLKTVFMAPTEILARQHYETLQKILAPFGVKMGLMTGSEKKIEHKPDIIVGTHALIYPVRSKPPEATADAPLAHRTSNGVQKGVHFENLGLVVVDEQHRFGVSQRAALVDRGKSAERMRESALTPHFLSMTATPIPRTLALTVYGDLDLSLLDEMPKSRKEIITRIVEPSKRQDAYQFIREEIKRGRQAFVICPRIEANDPNEKLKVKNEKLYQQRLLLAEVKSVKEEYKKLKEEMFKDLEVGMLHGKMPARGGSASGGKSKEQVMREFREGKIDILVSTSVVEVGVDIPNATIMMIEGAERFGLSQLHQFRGRVGRGAEQSYCLLFPTEDGMAAKRLRAVVEARTGFELAEKDLEIRGPGDIFGQRQWGVPDEIIIALSDVKLVRAARNEAAEILQKDPELKNNLALRERLERMEKEVHPE